MCVNVTLSQLCPDLIIKRCRQMKKIMVTIYFIFILRFKCSAFTLKAPPFTSSWPLRSCPAAPPAGLCCCLSDHHSKERLRRQRRPTSAEHLKPLGVCEAPTGSGRLTVSRTDGWVTAGRRRAAREDSDMGHARALLAPLRIATKPASCYRCVAFDYLQPAARSA